MISRVIIRVTPFRALLTLLMTYLLRLMDKILHDPKDPKLWELWYTFLIMGNAGFCPSTLPHPKPEIAHLHDVRTSPAAWLLGRRSSPFSVAKLARSTRSAKPHRLCPPSCVFKTQTLQP